MNEILLFSIGAVLFIFLTWATLMFLYLRFNEVYRLDQANSPGDLEIVMDGNVEVLSTPNHASS
ncbi:MAG: hypothetical protein QNJ77_01555 [Acidimicrobiia bacterium]|nr:hypothetical protein [Acidimicrobiia bacterium]